MFAQAFPNRIRRLAQALSLVALAAYGTVCPAQSQSAQPKLPVTQLSAGIYLINAELASSFRERELGLMYREAMGDNEGMVFTFDGPEQVCMWMKNTVLPLSVAFMDDSGSIINIEDMRPQTLDNHCAKRNARYALEMNFGWFAKHGVRAGSKISGLPHP
jgi:uncharacterized protein